MYISSSLARAIKDKWIHPVTEEGMRAAGKL